MTDCSCFANKVKVGCEIGANVENRDSSDLLKVTAQKFEYFVP